MRVVIVFSVLCGVFYAASAMPGFSIADSNVPEIRYELNAVQALAEAYALYPDHPKQRVEAFSDLYGDIYNIPNGWNVVSACESFYTSKQRIYVDIQCVDEASNTTEIVKIFS